MTVRRAALVLAALSLCPVSIFAQSFNLRDLLTDFFRQGITLAEPPAGSTFPSHAHHFVGDASLVPLAQLNSELATQLSTFPLVSSAGGFTYQLDPALGVFTRASDSFGPIYADRADTIGKGKFAIGANFSHFSFDRIDDLRLRDGDVQIVLTHQDLPPAGCCLRPFVEGDVIVTRTFLKIQTDITAFTFVYGVRVPLRRDGSCRRRRRDPRRPRADPGPHGGDDRQARDWRQLEHRRDSQVSQRRGQRDVRTVGEGGRGGGRRPARELPRPVRSAGGPGRRAGWAGLGAGV